jgi:hypothetical protein
VDSLFDESPRFSKGDGARTEPAHYKLQAASPARDRGIGDEPEVDYFGSLRDDGAIDSGAHEYP